MTPNSVRIKNVLTVSNGAAISGNVVISNGQLVVGGTAINSTSVSEAANNAYTNAIAIAANAGNLSSGTVNIARIPVLDVVNNTSISFVATANSVKTSYDAAIAANTLANTAATAAGAAYTNAVSYTDTKIGTANTAITGNAATAYTNAVSYTDTKIGTANTAMAANADAAYTNATIFAANASNANNGTLAEARLPFRMDQNLRTTDSPTFANGNFTGTVTTATADLLGSVRSNITTVAASAVDCSLGNYFIKTAAGALTWTATNVPSTRAYSFILELTNGGTGAQTWYSGTKWPGGTAPTLVASGVDVLGFITDDGGTTWRGVQLMKDSK